MNRRLLLSLSLVFFSNRAITQEAPQVFRDWIFERKDMGVPLGESCVASTVKKIGELSWKLSIVYNSKLENPTQIILRKVSSSYSPASDPFNQVSRNSRSALQVQKVRCAANCGRRKQLGHRKIPRSRAI